MSLQTIKLASFLFPSSKICEEASLYYHEPSPSCVLKDGVLHMQSGDIISFDSYFNCFSYEKYSHFTCVTSVIARIKLQGSFIIRLWQAVLADNTDESTAKTTRAVNAVCLKEQQFSSLEPADAEIYCDISALSGNGIIYIELVCQSEGAIYEGGFYTTADINDKVKIGIVICTYKRDAYVRRNVANLADMFTGEQDLTHHFGVFIIDNGNTLQQSDFGCATLLQNRNLGGSGGFTRGIIEVYNRKEFSHILLMDDDLLFDTEILKRTLSILMTAKNPDHLTIGGSMLRLDKPYYQHEMGADWTGYTMISKNHGFDLRNTLDVVMNNMSALPDYTAWWYNCFPTSQIDRIGLPMPLFIKGDDIEYGIRAKNEVMLLNGIGVWHERFESKYSGELEYYIKRNELILNALYHPELKALFHFRKFVVAVGKQLVYQRYFAVDLIFKAYNDFLKGAKHLAVLDAEKVHTEIRAVVSKQRTLDDLLKMGYNVAEHEFFTGKNNGKHLKQIITLNGYLLPKWTYNKKERRTFRLVDMSTLQPHHFFRAYTVVQYNPDTKLAFITRQKRWRVVHSAFRLISMFFKLLFRYKKAARSYNNNLTDLTSFQSWYERLGITSDISS